MQNERNFKTFGLGTFQKTFNKSKIMNQCRNPEAFRRYLSFYPDLDRTWSNYFRKNSRRLVFSIDK
jgi:hypothetical protein